MSCPALRVPLSHLSTHSLIPSLFHPTVSDRKAQRPGEGVISLGAGAKASCEPRGMDAGSEPQSPLRAARTLTSKPPQPLVLFSEAGFHDTA